MNMIRTKAPSKTQINSLLLLQEICRKHDCISITFPMEEDCIYYLLYDEDNLLSSLCTFFNENGDWECCAYTQPLKRQRGYFTLLLEELLKEADDCDFIFPAEESCLDTVRTLEAMGASFWYREYIMELTSTAFLKTDLVKKSLWPGTLTVIPSSAPDKEPTQYKFIMNSRPVGSCYLDLRERSAYFYGFEIAEGLRNQGLGSACLTLLLEMFFAQPAAKRLKKLSLQVSGQNLPAIALYKKAGFQITESLSYYVY